MSGRRRPNGVCVHHTRLVDREALLSCVQSGQHCESVCTVLSLTINTAPTLMHLIPSVLWQCWLGNSYRTTCESRIQNRKTSFFGYGPLINPPPSLSKLTYNYNSMSTYIRVSFWFFSKKGFGLVFLKIGLGLVFVLWLRLGLGFRFEFGIGKLIDGAVGTVGWGSRKSPVTARPSSL